MGFGVILASGMSNDVMDAGAIDALIEVRVEQSMDQPTTFAIRFRDDICDNDFVMSSRPELQPGSVITIAVRDEDDKTIYCLVRGPIIESKASYTLGGPGSYFEVRGQDRRKLLGDQQKSARNTGTASEIAKDLLTCIYSTTDVQQGLPALGDSDKQGGGSNQHASPLTQLADLAREVGTFLWITYDKVSVSGNSLSLTETAHFATSPRRDAGASIAGFDLSSLASGGITLDGGAANACGPNITAFEASENWGAIDKADGAGVDAKSGNSDPLPANFPDALLKAGGTGLADLPGTRNISVTGAGNSEANQRRAQAALSEQGWYVTARASTSLHMLHEVVTPHTIVNVTGNRPAAFDAVPGEQGHSCGELRGPHDRHGTAHQPAHRPLGSIVMSADLIEALLESAARRFYGKYRGIVVANNDDSSRGRLQVKIPAVLGDTPVWALPCVPYAGDGVGFFALPEPDTAVWIEFEAGDLNYPIWVGCFWLDGQIDSSDAVPTVKFLKTAKFTLRIDDDSGEVSLEVESGSSLKLTTQDFTVQGKSITHQTDGAKIAMDAMSVEINDGAFKVT